MSDVISYQAFAISKAANYQDTEFQTELWVLALGGEIGELSNLAKKWLGHGHPLDRAKLLDECGDVCWYVAVLCESLGLSFDDLVRLRSFPPQSSEKEVATRSLLLHLQTSQGYLAAIFAYKPPGGWSVGAKSELQLILNWLSCLLVAHGFTLEEALVANVVKLNKRYPGGFSSDRSIKRAEPNEEGRETTGHSG